MGEGFRMAKKRVRRDIYKGRNDPDFDIEKDIDLAHLRQIMSVDAISNEDYNFYGLYVRNIIRIMLNSFHFKNYPADVKEDMSGEAMIGMLKARRKFDGEKYRTATAPFNYLYRIGFHCFQHVLTNYYRMQDRMKPESSVSSVPQLEASEEGALDWDTIAENLYA